MQVPSKEELTEMDTAIELLREGVAKNKAHNRALANGSKRLILFRIGSSI